MQTSDFDFPLPEELIAQSPLPERDHSRLLIIKKYFGPPPILVHQRVSDAPNHLRKGDILVLNNSRVIPARLRGMNSRTGGRFELLLIEEVAQNDWWAMIKPGKRAPLGTEIRLLRPDGSPTELLATVQEINSEGHRRLQFTGTPNISGNLDDLGEIPLPPYIRRNTPADLAEDKLRYQTVYSAPAGSVAAPTAGLHFTPRLLDEIRALGVTICFVTLHVGLGTFAPVKAEDLSGHVMHEERYELGEETARTINEARREGRRVIAVGTTTVRVLETVAEQNAGTLVAGTGRTRIFIRPPHVFKVVDGLLTNFHLPRSTLLMLVSAFVSPGRTEGREIILSAYAEAIREKYRFFSYGDAMLIV